MQTSSSLPGEEARTVFGYLELSAIGRFWELFTQSPPLILLELYCFSLIAAHLHPDAQKQDTILRRVVHYLILWIGAVSAIYLVKNLIWLKPAEVSSSAIEVLLFIVSAVIALLPFLLTHRATALDTEQGRAKKALLVSEEKFSKVFKASPLPVVLATLEQGVLIEVNEAFETLSGYSKAELVGASSVDLDLWFSEEDRGEVLLELKQHGRVREKEFNFRNKLGRIINVLYSCELIEIEDKKCLLAVIQDNSFRKQSMEALQKAVGEYESLFVDSPCGICRADVDGRLQLVNPALVEMLGYVSAQPLLSVNLWTDIYADGTERSCALNALRRGDRQMRGTECSWRCADGRLIRVRTSMHVIRNRDGVVDRIETIAEDMTQQRAIEQQLRHSQKMEALVLLVGGIAHDFNNILTGILGYGQMLLRGVTPEDKRHRRLSAIVEAALQGKALTSGLMAFSRQESTGYVRFDPNRVIQEMVDLFRRLLGERIEILFDPSADEIVVLGDPGQFQQILMNLAVNARDALPTGGELRIKTTNRRIGAGTDPEFPEAPPGDYVLLQVQDDGIGMDAATKDRMFDPFFTTKPPGKGTGLGLATFYGIVKQMKGFISVESELGRGTCIRVVFPLMNKPTETHLFEQEQMPSGTGSKVLVVEDDSIVRYMLMELLTQSGYDVAAAADGDHAAALAKSSNFEIDLLISDVVMPNCSGLELADKLSLLCPNLKVLFISGYFEDLALQECVRRGTASVLFKPFSESELAARVRQVLSQAA